MNKTETNEIKILNSPGIESNQIDSSQASAVAVGSSNHSGLFSLLSVVALIVIGTVLVFLFNDDVTRIGVELLHRYGQTNIDIILFVITAISCSPICLPVWIYIITGAAMGYNILHLAVVLAVGSAVGSLITYYLGAYFSERKFFRKRFPKAQDHPWINGKSRWIVTSLVFLGTASPIPCDAFYLTCGVKRFSVSLFFSAAVAGRFVRYIYLGYGFGTIMGWFKPLFG